MAFLCDTNVLLRIVPLHDPAREVALAALRALRHRKESLYYTPQVLAEFWNVCTRPVSARGGFGFPPPEAERRARLIERYLDVVPDNMATYRTWRRLIVVHAVSGVQVHDARLVASMLVYGITHLLTFDTEDFRRYPIAVVTPHDLAQAQA